MENNKFQKRKIIQMRYPAPYSQSWSNTEFPKISDKIKNLSQTCNRNSSPNKCEHRWFHPKPLKYGCNPYAPHLKYGLFPRKVHREGSLKPANNRSNITPKEDIHVKKDRKPKSVKKGQHQNTLHPTRVIDRRRHLSKSEVTHVDIKPRKLISPKGSRAISPKHRFGRNILY